MGLWQTSKTIPTNSSLYPAVPQGLSLLALLWVLSTHPAPLLRVDQEGLALLVALAALGSSCCSGCLPSHSRWQHWHWEAGWSKPQPQSAADSSSLVAWGRWFWNVMFIVSWNKPRKKKKKSLGRFFNIYQMTQKAKKKHFSRTVWNKVILYYPNKNVFLFIWTLCVFDLLLLLLLLLIFLRILEVTGEEATCFWNRFWVYGLHARYWSNQVAHMRFHLLQAVALDSKR